MQKTVINIARPLPEALMQALEQFGTVHLLTENEGVQEDSRILVTTAMDPVSAEMIAELPNSLGLIANIGVGIDNVDIEVARARNIAVSNTPVVTEDTADLTMALLLACCRRLGESERHLRAGNWSAGANQLGVRVHGKTLGIIGLGAIGRAVARRAQGFGMSVLYHGPNRKPQAEVELAVEYRADLTQLLAEADIISLNCALTSGTQHLLNRETLAAAKPGAIIINTGRGPLIDETALVEALTSGHLGGAGLDVFELEPQVTPALLTLDKVTLLPHIGSATAECRTDMAHRVLANIQQFLKEGVPLDCCH